jgi:hypothetical protein
LCWQNVETSDPEPLGSPACETSYTTETIKYYFKSTVDDLEQTIQTALDGEVTIDCSQEESGYCRGIVGASGTYGLWTKAVFESKEIYGDPNEVGTTVSLNYTIEDCGEPGLPPPDMSFSHLVRRVRPGQVMTTSGATVPMDCDGWSNEEMEL